MKEVEIKILEIDISDIEKKLQSLGAIKLEKRIIVDKGYDNENRDIDKKDDLLRLRLDGKKSYLTFKTNVERGIVRSADEYEVEVSNLETAEKILQGLGYKVVKHREKFRTSYELEKTRIEIDEFENIPPYLEIEGDEADIKHVVALLGFTMADTTNWTATQVLKHYHQNPNMQVLTLS